MNHHSLADFRTEHEAWLNTQLTSSIASLAEPRLVTLNVVPQDWLTLCAPTNTSGLHRRVQPAEPHSQEQEI